MNRPDRFSGSSKGRRADYHVGDGGSSGGGRLNSRGRCHRDGRRPSAWCAPMRKAVSRRHGSARDVKGLPAPVSRDVADVSPFATNPAGLHPPKPQQLPGAIWQDPIEPATGESGRSAFPSRLADTLEQRFRIVARCARRAARRWPRSWSVMAASAIESYGMVELAWQRMTRSLPAGIASETLVRTTMIEPAETTCAIANWISAERWPSAMRKTVSRGLTETSRMNREVSHSRED